MIQARRNLGVCYIFLLASILFRFVSIKFSGELEPITWIFIMGSAILVLVVGSKVNYNKTPIRVFVGITIVSNLLSLFIRSSSIIYVLFVIGIISIINIISMIIVTKNLFTSNY